MNHQLIGGLYKRWMKRGYSGLNPIVSKMPDGESMMSYSELICGRRQYFITSQSLSVIADFIKIWRWQDEGVSAVTAKKLLTYYLDKQYPEAIYLSAFAPALAGPATDSEAWFYLQVEVAADLAYPTAMYHYGACLDLGEYFSQDKRRASQLFQRAADCGHAHSQWIHGIELLYGSGSYAANRERGLMYIQRAAQKKFIAALESLGKFYEDGEFVEKDLEKSLLYREQMKDDDVIDYT